MSTPADALIEPPASRPPEARPSWVDPRPKPRLNVGLRQFMLLLIYFAVAFLAGRGVWETQSPPAASFLIFWLGVGLAYLGWWLLTRLGRLALIGWVGIFLGQAVASTAILGTFNLDVAIPLGVFGTVGATELPVFLPGPLAWPAILIFGGVVFYLNTAHRRSRQGGLLWVLAMAADRALPLAPGVEAYAQEQGGIARDQVHALAGHLDEGKPLATALEVVPGLVPWDAPILVRVGEEAGRLADSLRTAAEIRSRRHHVLRDVLGRVGYLIGTLATLLVLLIGLNYYVLPHYAAILQTFEMPLGPVTARLVAWAEFVERNRIWGVGILMAILGSLSLSLGLRGWAGLPVVGRIFRLRHRALILRCLALTVRAGRPIEPVVALLARHYPSRPVRRRLRRAGEQMARGIGWTDALRYARLVGEAEVGVLDAAARAGNLPWALDALADSGERRFAYRLQFSTQVLFALTLLGLAAAVLFVALALFLPLVALIEGLAE